jgi:prephenate dehydrogenase
VDGAEIVLLAVSTSQTPALLLEAAAAAPEALFTDAASLKRSVAAAAAALPGATCFVGGHPMAGSRTAGIAGARADLFRDRPWLVVPTDRSDVRSIAAVQDLVRGIGARPAVVDAERHDALMTWASHLPHAVASALARAVSTGVGSGVERVAGPGLLDATRIADSSTDLALELALAEPEALAAAVEAVRRELDELAGSLRRGDRITLRDYFEKAASARRGFSPSPPGRGKG